MTTDRLKPYRFRIIFERGRFKGSAIHVFYATDQHIADGYAKSWASRRKATKLTRLGKDK